MVLLMSNLGHGRLGVMALGHGHIGVMAFSYLFSVLVFGCLNGPFGT